MGKVLYICENPFIMYKILIKGCMTAKDEQQDLIIADNIESMQPLIKPIEKARIFDKVYTYHYDRNDHIHTMTVERGNNFLSTMLLFSKRYWRATLHQKDLRKDSQLDKIDFSIYDKIYASDFDVSRINGYLAVHGYYYTLMEHAKYVFDKQNVGLVYNVFTYVSSFLEKFKMVTGIRIATKYCESVEVQEKKNLGKCLRLKKIKEWNIEKAVECLNEEERDNIFKIYAEAYNINIDYLQKYNVLLTNPLYKDRLVFSEEQQCSFYKNIIEEYFDRDNPILIKAHPRDEVNYQAYFKNSVVIPKEMSSEVLTFAQRLHLNKILTFYSTSVQMFEKKAEELICIEKTEKDARSSKVLEKFLNEWREEKNENSCSCSNEIK